MKKLFLLTLVSVFFAILTAAIVACGDAKGDTQEPEQIEELTKLEYEAINRFFAANPKIKYTHLDTYIEIAESPERELLDSKGDGEFPPCIWRKMLKIDQCRIDHKLTVQDFKTYLTRKPR
jgi:hypothetical protein